MAITFGTPTNSGNQATATTFSFNHTLDINAKCLVVVITGYDSSATDSVVNSVYYNGMSLSEIPSGRYRVGSDFQTIFFIPNPFYFSGAAVSIQVNMGGACTDVQATAVGLIDSSATSIIYDSRNTATGTGSAACVVNPAKANSVAVGGGVAVGGLPASFSVTTGSEISGSEVDMGSQVASCATATASGTTASITWTYSAVVCTGIIATFYSQFAPVTSLSTPSNAGSTSDTTPDLVCSITDSNSDTSHVKVRVVSPAVASFSLKYVDFYLDKINSPTGTLNAIVYSDLWFKKVLGTSDDVAESTVSATGAWTRFTFASTISLVAGQTYYVGVARKSSVDAVNRCRLYVGPATNPYADGDLYNFGVGSWTGVEDAAFKLFDSTPTVKIQQTDTSGIPKNIQSYSAGNGQYVQEIVMGTVVFNDDSESNPSRFSGTPPYATGSTVTYTVPVGSALTVGNTYYWTTQGKTEQLPSVYLYSNFATPYSFTVTSGTPTNLVLMCIES